MSGLLEQIMGKMDTLIAELNANTAARLAEGGGAAAATDKPSTGRGRKAADKPAEDKPNTTEAELVAKFDTLKGRGGDVVPKLKKIIADQGFATLPELRQAPAKFDSAMAALVALETELDAAPADDDDL